MDKNRIQKLAGIREGTGFKNGKFTLERFSVYSDYGNPVDNYESDDGDWCNSDDVAKIEKIANEMYDILNELVQDYYVHSDVDLKIVAQEAREVIKKAKSL